MRGNKNTDDAKIKELELLRKINEKATKRGGQERVKSLLR